MQLSQNMELIQNTSDELFLGFLQYLRPYQFEDWEYKLCMRMIEERVQKMGYTFEFGCCGRNTIRRIQ
jgi:hypothetical protein